MSSPTTAEAPAVRELAVPKIGPVALRLLRQMAQARVSAVFRSAFHVEGSGGLLCIGTAALEAGPLALVSAAPADADWRAVGIVLWTPAAASAGLVQVGDRVRFRLGAAAEWWPEPLAGPVTPAAVARGLAALRAALAGRAVAGGLGGFAEPGYLPGPDHREGMAAARAIAAARDWLVAALGNGQRRSDCPAGWAGRLVGLGPGLTPSGDDFLGGMMLALHALGREGLARVLWDSIRPDLGRRTNSISAALLGAASSGTGSSGLHVALAAILRGDPAAVRTAAPVLDRVGHSSGWDAMAGMATVFGAWLEAQPAVSR